MLWYILKLGGFDNGLELFIEEFYKIPVEKINEKTLLEPRLLTKWAITVALDMANRAYSTHLRQPHKAGQWLVAIIAHMT